MSRGTRRLGEIGLLVLVGLLFVIPATAVAQSAIAGTVTDTTGAVLPATGGERQQRTAESPPGPSGWSRPQPDHLRPQ